MKKALYKIPAWAAGAEKLYQQLLVSPVLDFLDSILRGAGQLFLCNNPLSGLFFILAMYLIWPGETLLSLVGLFTATFICHLFYQRYWMVKNGLVGSNGFLTGLTMAFFPDIPATVSLALVIAGSLLSALITYEVYMGLQTRTRVQLLCFPALVASLVMMGAIFTSGLGSRHTLAGWALYRKGDYAASARFFSQALAVNPDLQSAHAGLGWSTYRQDQFSYAIKEFNRLENLAPGSATAATGTGWCLFKMGNLERAEENFLRALERDTHAGDALLGLGWISWSCGNYDEAADYFRRALKMRGSVADAYMGLAWSSITLKKYDRAYSMLHRARFFSPSYKDVRESLEYLRTLRPEPEEELFSLLEDLPLLAGRYGPTLVFPLLLILAGILVHSRISFVFALAGLCGALGFVSLRTIAPEFESLPFIYNMIAISIACGGLFFVMNRSSLMLWLFSLLLCSFLWLIAARCLEPLGLPPLGLPFALALTLLLIPFAGGILEDGAGGVYPAGFDMVATSPEKVLQWKKRQAISLLYWEKIRRLEKDWKEG